MKPIVKKFDKKAAFTPLETKPHPLGIVPKRGGGLRSQGSFLTGFTIIELMTVMSVIIILIALLVPALKKFRAYAGGVATRNNLYAITVGLEGFIAEWDDYPASKPVPIMGATGPFSGANRLAEAMVGKDLLGYDPKGVYGTSDLSGRRQYLEVDRANAYKLEDLYQVGPLWQYRDQYVLCDEFRTTENKATGKLVGMPVLYYKADTSGKKHPVKAPYYKDPPDFDNGVATNDPQNIYNHEDNQRLLELRLPEAWDRGTHLMDARGLPTELDPPLDTSSAHVFYNNIWNKEIDIPQGRPCRADSYVLLSAGHDGKYGTDDDIFNFPRKYRRPD